MLLDDDIASHAAGPEAAYIIRRQPPEGDAMTTPTHPLVVRPPLKRGLRELFAVLLLLTGFPPIFGWIVGLGLLMWSPLWTVRQKLLGALVWPGGGFMVLSAGLLIPTSHTVCVSTSRVQLHGVESTVSTLGSVARSCTSTGSSSPWAAIGIAVALVAPLIVAVYLYRSAGRHSVHA